MLLTSRPPIWSLFACAVLLLAACAGLGSEPAIVSTLVPPTPTVDEPEHPNTPPDVALGAQLYAARCIDCHGASGAGDGALVASGQVGNPGNFRQSDAARSQRPTEWFATITNGRIDKLMPPWKDALTYDERWAVAMYTYTLHYTSEQLALGREVFARTCAECHGEGGLGDGERADEFGGFTPNLTDLEAMTTLSDEHLYNIVTEGQGREMEGLADVLTEDERRAVVTFARTLSLTNPQAIAQQVSQQPAETAEPAPAASVGTVGGSIANGTVGGAVPANLSVILLYYDEELRETAVETVSDAAGNFAFADVPISPTYQYVTLVTYQEQSFFSAPVFGETTTGALDLDVTIYELTNDADAISISGMVAQLTAVGDSLEVTQLFTLRNASDRAYTSGQTSADGRPISVTLALPPGAVVLSFPNGEGRYGVGADGFSVFDTAVVLPNTDHIVAVVYIIPYTGSAIIEQPLTYALNGPLRVLVRPPSITLQSAQLPSTGVETVGETEWQGYGGILTFPAGDVLRYELSGAAQEVASRDTGSGIVPANNLLPLLVCGIVAEIALVAGLYLWWRRRRQRRAAQPAIPPADPTLIDGFVRQIAELDAQHERGEIDTAAYQQQRAFLKARLADLMERK
jgi:mono/diheme cytochrome c family protein